MNSKFRNFIIENSTYLIFALLVVICIALSPNFFTVMNLRNLMLQQAAPICISMGMLLVIMTGGIDLSVGSLQALGASVTAILISEHSFSTGSSILISLIIGLICGIFVGILVAYAGMQGFVASLAMMTIARGIAFVLTQGSPIMMPAGTVDNFVMKSHLYPIIWITLIIVIVLMFLQKYSSYGRLILAIGSNVEAVSLAGIPVKKYITSVYAISGVLASLSGIFIAARASTGAATIGQGNELIAIAACVIGGASLSGGKGSFLKTLVGALIFALIGNIMNLLAVPSYPQDIIQGFIIIAAVLLQVYLDKQEMSEK